MMFLVLVPVLAWYFLPPWLQPFVAWLAGVLCVAALLRWAWMIWRDQRRLLDHPARGSWRWRKAWNAATYGRRLTLWLRLNGWRISMVRELDADRLLVTGATARQLVSLLCVRPGRQAVAEDLALLEQDRRGRGSTALSVVVSDGREDASAGGPLQVKFAEVPSLGERLG